MVNYRCRAVYLKRPGEPDLQVGLYLGIRAANFDIQRFMASERASLRPVTLYVQEVVTTKASLCSLMGSKELERYAFDPLWSNVRETTAVELAG